MHGNKSVKYTVLIYFVKFTQVNIQVYKVRGKLAAVKINPKTFFLHLLLVKYLVINIII